MGPLEPISPGWNIMRTWFPAVTVTKHMSAETFLLWIRTFFELACKTFKRTHDEITQNSPKSHTALRFVIKHINRVLSSPFFIFYFFLLEALECVTFRSDREKRDEVVFGWCIPVINANWQWTRALQQKVAPSETSIWWPPKHLYRQPPPRLWLHPRGKDASLVTDTHRSGFPLMSGFSYYNPQLSVDCILKHTSRIVPQSQCLCMFYF